jgi:hypothetical protein
MATDATMDAAARAVGRAAQCCRALDDFLVVHAEALVNKRVATWWGTFSSAPLALDVSATRAAFRLFFLVTERMGPESDLHWYMRRNASLIEVSAADGSMSDLTPVQRVDALVRAGLELSYGFVWRADG